MPMDKVGGGVLFVCLLLCLGSTIGVGDDEEEQSKKPCVWEWQRLRSAYSAYSALFPTTLTSISSIGRMLKHAYACFFPPNIDFRRGDDAEGVTEKDGAGEKVKEALAKSLGKSKATVEDAAKSAAILAGETMHRLKSTSTSSQFKESDTQTQTQTQRQDEL